MTVTTQNRGSARTITWDDRAKRNPWSRAVLDAIADEIEQAGADEDVRCIVMRGAGEDFSSGDDLREAATADAESWAATIHAFQRATRVVLDAPVPVIAAIDGVCIGGALEFAASCDLRIATDRARFGTPEVRIGLIATNAGTLLLPEVLGETAARELLLTGGLRDAAWAQRNGFLNAVVTAADLDEAVAGWAAMFDVAARPAVARTKLLLNSRFGHLLDEAIDRETQGCIDLFDTPEAREAVQGSAHR